MEFKLGDLVRLKSGGPRMTVEGEPGNGSYVRCVWFDSPYHGVYREAFLSGLLDKEVAEEK